MDIMCHTVASKNEQEGFTIIEVIVTLIVLSIFLFGFFQTFLLLESQRVNVGRQAKASDLAYSYLRNYNGRPDDPNTGAPLQCSGTARTLVTTPATGQGLGNSAVISVIVSAPNGCSGTNFAGGIIKIEAVVTYSTNQEVRHATYVN